jgi:hypothetical protein
MENHQPWRIKDSHPLQVFLSFLNKDKISNHDQQKKHITHKYSINAIRQESFCTCNGLVSTDLLFLTISHF